MPINFEKKFTPSSAIDAMNNVGAAGGADLITKADSDRITILRLIEVTERKLTEAEMNEVNELGQKFLKLLVEATSSTIAALNKTLLDSLAE